MSKHFFHTSSGKDEYLTPQWVLQPLGKFDLDPCAPVIRPWPTAKKHYTICDDGLSRKWHGRVWLNPPYGREASKWVTRLCEHGNGIALIYAKTETKMFHELIFGKADAILFIRKRIHFCDVKGNETAGYFGPSVLIAYGRENAYILKKCLYGYFVWL